VLSWVQLRDTDDPNDPTVGGENVVGCVGNGCGISFKSCTDRAVVLELPAVPGVSKNSDHDILRGRDDDGLSVKDVDVRLLR
jgi:hypothetical protein